MEKENKDINSIFIEIRKNIDGEFLIEYIFQTLFKQERKNPHCLF